MTFGRSLALAATGAVLLSNPAGAQLTVRYEVTVNTPHEHIFNVRMEIAHAGGAALDVSMPVWTPGSYLIREYERHVTRFAARGASGAPLAWHKVDKNTWRIASGGAGSLVVEYDVYAREPGIRWSFVNDLGGHIIGPNLFMFVVGHTDLASSARFHLPDGWRLSGGIVAASDDPFLILARSYHELVDTPMLIGEFSDTTFTVEGVPHVIGILGPHNADLHQLSEDFTRIVEACSALFGGLPYQRYALIYMTLTGGGGIEHANGTTIGLGPIDFRTGQSREGVRGVTSHEFFHAWNVKRIQPPAFRPYNYEEENYTDALWFYEGFTSYYSDRILHRAGLRDELGDPAGLVEQYRSTPGNYNQSAADASFNAWIHLYRGDESTNNYRADYYFGGQVIANLLELEIANRTAGAKGLDDLMRTIWARTRDDGAAFDADAIRAVADEITGTSFREFFDKHVFGADSIPFADFFRLAGYDLVVDEPATRERNRTGYLGVFPGPTQDGVFLNGVGKGGPAWRAGLDYGDRIDSIGNVAITNYGAFSAALRQTQPGQTIDFVITRFGRPQTIPVTLGTRPVPVYRLDEGASPSERQLAVRRLWRQERR
ncbi:MAG TPA: PDZ domain-containing protein [Gemmatimonadales bacterium]